MRVTFEFWVLTLRSWGAGEQETQPKTKVNATITVLIIFLFSPEERVCQTEAIWRNSLTNDAISNYSSRPATTDHHWYTGPNNHWLKNLLSQTCSLWCCIICKISRCLVNDYCGLVLYYQIMQSIWHKLQIN